jgi:DNA polymerase-4
VRKILHVDMDAFYASVEQRDRPELRNRPVAVGSASERGVIMTASYEARRFGVGSAMPTARALRLCPELVVVPARFEAYRMVSTEVRSIFERYTDLVEPLALDEANHDVTEPRQGPASATLLARLIKADIHAETRLTASAGVSTGKFLAKVASALEKPDGLTVIPPDRAQAFLDELRIDRFHGVGPRTAERMRAVGIHTGADLRAFDPAEIERLFGKLGRFLHAAAHGIDDRPVVSHRDRKSLGAETTFARDQRDRAALEPVLEELCRELAARMERAQVTARTVTVKVRYADFSLITRGRTLQSDLDGLPALHATARVLAFDTPRPDGPIRLLGVTVTQLRERAHRVIQPALPFPEPSAKPSGR